MEFKHSLFWVQVHGLLLLCMSVGVGGKIGASLGDFIAADVARDGGGWGQSLRLRVRLDITKPLERGRAIHVGGKTHWVTFKYEKLPIFCFRCGRILHEAGGCPERVVVGSEARWGPWLRADPQKNSFGVFREPRHGPAGSTGSPPTVVGRSFSAGINGDNYGSKPLRKENGTSGHHGISSSSPFPSKDCNRPTCNLRNNSSTNSLDRVMKRTEGEVPVTDSAGNSTSPTFVFNAVTGADVRGTHQRNNPIFDPGSFPLESLFNSGLGGPGLEKTHNFSEAQSKDLNEPVGGALPSPIFSIPVQKAPFPPGRISSTEAVAGSPPPLNVPTGSHMSVKSWKRSA